MGDKSVHVYTETDGIDEAFADILSVNKAKAEALAELGIEELSFRALSRACSVT